MKVIDFSASRKRKGLMLEEVLKKHGSALRSFLRARLVLEDDREDIYQELFLKLTRLGNLEEKLAARSGDTRSYLFSIATNLIIDFKRRAAVRHSEHHESFDEKMITTDYPPPDRVAATTQQLDAMMSLLKKMEPKCREALILNRFEHKSYPEVAREMGVSTTSVERYIASALKILREEMR